ncbi:MAG: Apolipoprotein N-acyltransferase [Acidimicrobiales bacterium]|nr:MAG: apolipoprotein N-acyltransferase [Actinomycetota bacterium]MBV6510114.1 Apolipoprotein N-acyltransferase [Acidimicrobiales bacterium]RIK05773.1 MAG: apolipoprotein N-acyltransferase [Acidobacteriota bacterium]
MSLPDSSTADTASEHPPAKVGGKGRGDVSEDESGSSRRAAFGVGWAGSRALLAGPLRTLVSGQSLGQAADGLAEITFAQVVLFEVGQGATPWEITKLLAVTLLPFTLVAPFAGVLVDRFDRRRVLVWVSIARAALVTATIVVLLVGSQALAYVAVVMLLSCSRFVLTAKGAALPRTVDPDGLVTANAISGIAGMSAAFMGALIGSSFVATTPTAGFLSAAALYCCASLVFSRLPPVGGGSTRTTAAGLRRVAVELRDEIRAVTKNFAVRRPLLAVWANRLLLGAGFILLVLVAEERYHFEAPGYGLALAVTGVAAFAGTWAAPVLASRYQPRALLPLAFLVGALAASVAGFLTNVTVLVVGVGLTAFAFQVLKINVDALVQEASPDLVRGRVFAVYDLLYNLAFVLAGLTLVPLWSPQRASELLWWLALAFLLAGLALARAGRTWPFTPAASYSTPSPAGPHDPAPAFRPGPVSRWSRRALAIALGAIASLGFPEASAWLLGFVGLVPLLMLVCTAASRREAGILTWLGGAGFFIAMHHWIVYKTLLFTPLLALALGLLWIPCGLLAWSLLRPSRLTGRRLGAAALLVPSAWVTAEFVRSWEKLGGPWGLLGASQWNNTEVLATASLGGVWLVSFVLVAVNVLLAAALLPGIASRRRISALAAATAIVSASFVYGASRPAPDVTAWVRVAGVQPGNVRGPQERLDANIGLTSQLDGTNVDLVMWGESSVAYDPDPDQPWVDELARLSREVGAPLLVNVDARRGQGGIYKSSVLIDSAGVADRYDKMRLVPFGEYVPLRPLLGWVSSLTDAPEEDRQRGEDLVVLEADDIRLGPLVCFESAFPDLSRQLASRGTDLLVLQTATTTFQGSWAQAQHASLAALRAVESGRPVVHAAVSGTSAIFDSHGSRLAWFDNDETGTYVAEVPLATGRTPYVRFGDWVPALCVVLLLGAALSRGMHAARCSAMSDNDPEVTTVGKKGGS